MASSNDLITNVGQNSNDTAALIWSVADDLVGAYKPHEYGLVILPMTVIKRFHDCLLPTHRERRFLVHSIGLSVLQYQSIYIQDIDC